MRASLELKERRERARLTSTSIDPSERGHVVAWLEAQADVAEDVGRYEAAAALSNAAELLRSTMQVLEERRQPVWAKEVVCTGQTASRSKPGCGSSLRITADDLTQLMDYNRPNGGTKVAVFKCPLDHCGVETDLLQAEVPGWIFDSLKAGKQRGQPIYYSGCGKD